MSALRSLPQLKGVTWTPWIQRHAIYSSIETDVTAFHLHLHPVSAVPSSHWIIGAPLWGLHKERGARRTPHSEPLTFTSQQKQSRGRGGNETARWTVGDRDSTDEMGGVGKRGGWFVWPLSTCSEEKQAKTPALDKGCYGNPSPLGHKISGESTDRMCLQRVCGNTKKCYVITTV